MSCMNSKRQSRIPWPPWLECVPRLRQISDERQIEHPVDTMQKMVWSDKRLQVDAHLRLRPRGGMHSLHGNLREQTVKRMERQHAEKPAFTRNN